jgi:prolyl oligopeptidase
VLDLDALAKTEGANWFWAGADCAEPDERRCMVALSDGGEDAVTLREFDVPSARFVSGGFSLPRGKQSFAWQDGDTLLVAREWAPGELTKSSYPYVVKRLARGRPAEDAVEVFRGTSDDVGVSPAALHDGAGHRIVLIERRVSYFEAERYLVGPQGTARLALPGRSDLLGLVEGRLIAIVRENWDAGDGRTVREGSVVSIALDALRADPAHLRPDVVFAPGPREAFVDARVKRRHQIVVALDNVKGRAYLYTPGARRGWSRRRLALPDNASIRIASADLHSDRAYLGVESFLVPSTMWLADAATGALREVKALPPRFDASHHIVEQLEATSKDGTAVPYFLVRPRDMKRDESTPTLLTAYGGFNVSLTPYYPAYTGKLWLERGGAYAVANIRGGGEFGPAWHDAGLKTNRQKVFDDFAAIAEQLVARGVTSARHLGIEGGSNGGLLMGAEMIQHPDLFAAVDMQVPLLDMLRYEHIAAGSSWVGEYGSVFNPGERAFLASISPYQNLDAGVRYPEPLIWTTTKDDRVGPQHARKFAAKMAEMGAPYLYYEVVEGGHGSGATLEQRAAMTAREFTYFGRALGLR